MRDGLYQHLHTLELPNYLALQELASVQQSWIDGRMTNFDYLTHLNKIAGRSFNDLMQYPIFPFILKDYFSDRLNLCDEKSFRYILMKYIALDNGSRQEYYVCHLFPSNFDWQFYYKFCSSLLKIYFFRNLSKPMSVQCKEKEQKYIDNYNVSRIHRSLSLLLTWMRIEFDWSNAKVFWGSFNENSLIWISRYWSRREIEGELTIRC